MMKKKKITPDIFSVPAAICPLIQRKYGVAELSLYEPIKLLTGSLVVIRQPISTHLFINIVSWPITKKKKFWLLRMRSVQKMYHALLPEDDE